MFIRVNELFEGISEELIAKINGIALQEYHEEGHFLYSSGDPADYFYILDEGNVTLSYGTGARLNYILNIPGEAFGLSSLLKCSSYSASAQCRATTKVRKIDRVKLSRLLEEDPKGGISFFQHLAGIIFQRMVDGYNSLVSAYR
jgi:CRP-like cAMP-binding protein